MELQDKGFVILKNVLGPSEVEIGLNCIKDTTANYSCMNKFVKDTFLFQIGKQLNWSRPICTKYRVSDGNNSSDASAFHRDIICVPGTPSLPVYTCLIYFDKTNMEVIPGSHLNYFYKYSEMVGLFNKKQKITLVPGDILVFNSCLLHRGIFTEGLKHRRLLQVFEVFPNETIFNKLNKVIVHVPGKEIGRASCRERVYSSV